MMGQLLTISTYSIYYMLGTSISTWDSHSYNLHRNTVWEKPLSSDYLAMWWSEYRGKDQGYSITMNQELRPHKVSRTRHPYISSPELTGRENEGIKRDQKVWGNSTLWWLDKVWLGLDTDDGLAALQTTLASWVGVRAANLYPRALRVYLEQKVSHDIFYKDK